MYLFAQINSRSAYPKLMFMANTISQAFPPFSFVMVIVDFVEYFGDHVRWQCPLDYILLSHAIWTSIAQMTMRFDTCRNKL